MSMLIENTKKIIYLNNIMLCMSKKFLREKELGMNFNVKMQICDMKISEKISTVQRFIDYTFYKLIKSWLVSKMW